MSKQSSRTRLTALGCVVLAGGLLLPSPAFADSTATPTPILDAARRLATAAKAREGAQGQPAPASNTDLRSGSFFKSKAGMATIVIFAAGVGYAVYSSSNDRIRSTGR